MSLRENFPEGFSFIARWNLLNEEVVFVVENVNMSFDCERLNLKHLWRFSLIRPFTHATFLSVIAVLSALGRGLSFVSLLVFSYEFTMVANIQHKFL